MTINLSRLNGDNISVPLQIIAWSDGGAAGIVPDVQGVLNQQATLTVQNAICAATSNAWTLIFNATVDYEIIGSDQILCSEVGQSLGSDQCQRQGTAGFPPECFLNLNFLDQTRPLGPPSFWAYHTSGWGLGNPGADTFFAATLLKNGCGLDHVAPLDVSSDDNSSYAYLLSGGMPGSPMVQITVEWRVASCDALIYNGYIYISGPLGTAPF
jgi:hypothetical protein